MKRVSLYLDDEMYKEVETLARGDKRSINSMFKRIVDVALTNRRQYHEDVREGR
jgi:hypothetical protein